MRTRFFYLIFFALILVGVLSVFIITQKPVEDEVMNQIISPNQSGLDEEQDRKNSSCPEGYVRIPHDDYFTQKDFCVMKWEAKAKNTSSGQIDQDGCGPRGSLNICDGDENWAELSVFKPVSIADGAPWRDINFTQAYSACSNLGSNYHLVTNREWMTIARNIEGNPSNWHNRTVGNSSIPQGFHEGYHPAPNGTMECQYANGSGRCSSSGTFDDRRIHILSNGDKIWDLSGNVAEWVDANENGTGISTGNVCLGSGGLYSFIKNDGEPKCTFQNGFAKSGASDVRFEVGPEGTFGANDGVGRIYSIDLSNRVFVRGGFWNSGARAGVFGLNLLPVPLVSDPSIGFRCSYTP